MAPNDIAPHMTAPPETYRYRRRVLAASLRRPLVVCAGWPPARNYANNVYPFRAGSTYLYFGGPPCEGAAWFIEPGSDGADGCTLLRVPPGPDDPLWFGEVPDDGTLAAAAGLNLSRIADLEQLPNLIRGRQAGCIAPPCVRTAEQIRNWDLLPADPAELRAVIDLRLSKDEFEQAAMRCAADVGIHAHRAALVAARPGADEAVVEAAWCSALTAGRCRPSFTPIVTVRGEVLHGNNAARTLHPGALLLIDAGAEEPGGYASDITRTAPIGGRFTPIQRQLYDTVQRARTQAVAACRPGQRYRAIHDLAAQVITAGLVEAGLLRGDPADLAARGAYTLFFPHGVGHLLGLDVHDMEDFGDLAGYAPGRARPGRFGDSFLRLDRDLLPGMTVTIEPGIYLVPAIWRRADLLQPFADAVNRPAIDALLAANFGGIRVEDNVLVCPEPAEPEVLTAALPSAADDIPALLGTA